MKTSIIKDINGSPYIGIDILKTHYNMFGLLMTWAFNNIDNFIFCNDNLLLRNNNKYHLTLFNVMECNKSTNLLFYNDININDIKLTGIGSISINDMTTYFIVCKSKKLNTIRKNVNFEIKDLHITIGFTKKDLFHDRKNNTNIFDIYL
jgi:hypothetical protein